tara:strand:- start:348 stop:953 length:606 start_codon:yes stop_codon:yes gene_type:complete
MSKIQANQIQHTQNGAAVFTLPTSDGSTGQVMKTDGSGALSFVTQSAAGISQADEWRVHTNFDTYDAYLTSNWERNDTAFSLIGSGMTESSGVFTFPATGIYSVDFRLGAYRTSAQYIRYVGAFIYATTDNSSWNTRAQSYGSIADDAIANCTVPAGMIFDVQDTSTHKVKFRILAEDTVTVRTGTDRQDTGVRFIRLGDT